MMIPPSRILFPICLLLLSQRSSSRKLPSTSQLTSHGMRGVKHDGRRSLQPGGNSGGGQPGGGGQAGGGAGQPGGGGGGGGQPAAGAPPGGAMCGGMNANTCPPTRAPTTSPSTRPTPAPSAFPTKQPSSSPSFEPTISAAPSRSPSSHPSSLPSALPSGTPSSTPSQSSAPSLQPSSEPTKDPSSSPSAAPSLSHAPTMPIWDLQIVNGVDNSTCIQSPPSNGTIETDSFQFQYDLIVAPNMTLEQAQAVATGLESRLHLALSRKVLTCNYLAQSPFDIVGLTSGSPDQVQANASCSATHTGYECFVVDAQITGTIYFYPTVGRRRRMVDQAVVDEFIMLLKTVLPTLAGGPVVSGVDFQGFTNAAVVPGAPNDSSLGNSGAIPQSNNSNSSALLGKSRFSIIGGCVMAIAGIGLIAVMALVIRRRRSRAKAYLEHLDQVNDLQLDPETMAEINQQEYIVDDDDNDSFDGTKFQHIKLEDEKHDYRTCASPSCRACLEKAQQPIFIATEIEATIRSDLGPTNYSPHGHVQVSDTVAL